MLHGFVFDKGVFVIIVVTYDTNSEVKVVPFGRTIQIKTGYVVIVRYERKGVVYTTAYVNSRWFYCVNKAYSQIGEA